MNMNGYPGSRMFGPPPFFPVGQDDGSGGGMGGWGSMSGWGASSGLPPIPSVIPPTISAPTVTTPTTPTIPAAGASTGTRLGFNMPTANLALAGLSTIGNLWAAFKAQKLAKEQFRYTKEITDTNLANQIKSYNTTLADRSFSRAKVEGRDAASAQAYIDANSLRRYGT